jgi:hypothetical protein
VKGEKADPTGDLHKMEGTESKYNALFWKVHEFANTQREISRALCAALYATGLFAIAIVLLQNACAVLEITCSWG